MPYPESEDITYDVINGVKNRCTITALELYKYKTHKSNIENNPQVQDAIDSCSLPHTEENEKQLYNGIQERARHGYNDAQYELSRYYIEKDPQRRMYLLEQSAKNGYLYADSELCDIYENGEGVKKDRQRAISYLREIYSKRFGKFLTDKEIERDYLYKDDDSPNKEPTIYQQHVDAPSTSQFTYNQREHHPVDRDTITQALFQLGKSLLSLILPLITFVISVSILRNLMRYRIIRISFFIFIGTILLCFVTYLIGINPNSIGFHDENDAPNHVSSSSQQDYKNYLIKKATFYPETIQKLNEMKTVATITGNWHIKSESVGAHRIENSFIFSEPCSDPQNECSSLYLNGVDIIQPNEDDGEKVYQEGQGKTHYTPWKLSSIISIKNGTGFGCKASMANLVFDDFRTIPFHLTPCPIMAKDPEPSFTNPLWMMGIIPMPGDGSFPYTQSSIPDQEIYKEVQDHWSDTERSFLGEEIQQGHYPIAIIKDNKKINLEGTRWERETYKEVKQDMSPCYHDLDVTVLH